MRAFDPSNSVIRPIDSYHANLFYYDVGMDFYEHQDFYLEYQDTEEFKPLKTLLDENQGLYRTRYLQMYEYDFTLGHPKKLQDLIFASTQQNSERSHGRTKSFESVVVSAHTLSHEIF